MEIITGYPPNFDEIKAALPAAKGEGVIFAYFPYVYKPHGKAELPPELVAHEQVHLDRQDAGEGPERWWKDYIASPAYRFEEEKVAHIEEAKSLVAQHGDCNRQKRREIAARVGKRLASSLYGGVINKQKAIKMIQGHLKPEPVA